jgi:hypothetical protein
VTRIPVVTDSGLAEQHVLGWLVGSSILLVLLTVGIYRAYARTFDRGPRDT